MKDEENIFEDLENDNFEDEIVSSDSQEIEEQPTMDVPSNSNRGKITPRRKYSDELSEIKNKQWKNENVTKNNPRDNKETINKLNDINSKKHGIPNAGEMGKQVGNKIAGKSEEEKSALEKKTDDIGGKAASTAITAATGGVVSGPIADAVGNAAYQVFKKQQEKKKKKIKIMVGISVGITVFLILFVVIFFNDDDESDTSVVTNNYVTSDMTQEELIDYLSYIGICPDTEEIKKKLGEYENIFDAINEYEESTQTCKNAIEYYDSLKNEYDENKKACYRNRKKEDGVLPNFWKTKDGGEAKYDNNPKVISYFNGSHWKDDPDCQITLPTQLFMESMSYDLDDQELFNKEYTDRFESYSKDMRKLANATSEFVHEYCFQWEYTINGERDGNGCDPVESAKKGVSCKKAKVRYDGYYFQASFNKYICYLKYGDSCNHPNYYEKPIVKGNPKNYYEVECSGPGNDHLRNEADDLSTSLGNVCTDKCKAAVEAGTDTFTTCYQQCITGTDEDDDKDDKDDNNGQTYDGDVNTIVEYALQFVGNPYVWGGESLTEGADCSGFVKSVFANFGVSLPHSAASLARVGAEVSEPQPGDLITYSPNSEGVYHVAIYIGNGQIVHAAGKKSGIKISNNYAYREISSIRRVIN